MEVTYFNMEDFAADAPGRVGKLARNVALSAQKVVFEEIKPYVRAMTPVGGIFGRDRHPGLLKRSWVDRQQSGGPMVVANLSAGDEPAAYGAIIDRGRKRGVTARGQVRTSHKKGKPIREARMLGSKQAPRGMTKPTVTYVMSHKEAIITKAIKVAEESS